jgi:hypothetical protein
MSQNPFNVTSVDIATDDALRITIYGEVAQNST